MSMSQGFKPPFGVLETGFGILAGGWVIGATGAVGVKVGAQGLTLTRTGAGAYTIQVVGTKAVAAGVPNFLHATVSVWNPDADPSNDTDAHFVKMLTITNTTGAITFQCVDEAGVVRELPNPALITCAVFVKLSSKP